MKHQRSAQSKGFRLEAMAIEIPDFPGHPNRVSFSGVLALVDTPSDQPPAGAAGHRVLLPRAVAEQALPSLLGMAVDFAPGLRGHDARRKIGVITRAEIVANRLEVGGYLFGKDFPEVVRELRARRDRLGMSYEVTEVRVADTAARVWVLNHVVFTGAAILERAAAAYQKTSLAARAAFPEPGGAHAPQPNEGETMNEKIAQTLDLVAQASQALTAEFAGLRTLLEEMRRTQEHITQLVEQRTAAAPTQLEARVDELTRASDALRRQNDALREQTERFAAQVTRKTVPPQVLTLLSKAGVGADVMGSNGKVDVVVLDKALDGLPVEQRIAVKSQLARAGALE
jgi:chaperonin cofactor prefoldin